MTRLPDKPHMKITRTTMRLPELTRLLRKAEYIREDEKVIDVEVDGNLLIIYLEEI